MRTKEEILKSPISGKEELKIAVPILTLEVFIDIRDLLIKLLVEIKK